MTGRGSRAILIALSVFTLGGCEEPRRLTLDPAPPDLADLSRPIELDLSSILVKKHGEIAAGASHGASIAVDDRTRGQSLMPWPG